MAKYSKKKALMIASYTVMALSLALTATGGAVISSEAKTTNELCEKYGYEEFNADYKDKLMAEYEIAYDGEELKQHLNDVQDYSTSQFIQENGTPEDAETYPKSTKKMESMAWMGSISGTAGILGGMTTGLVALSMRDDKERIM